MDVLTVYATPKETLVNDYEEEMFLEGKTYRLTRSGDSVKYITIDEQGLRNYLSSEYIRKNFHERDVL
ncbi:hypothetical protein P5763_07270 [Bacillus cereus]|uniref:hypothetical protein n=1 Tax=Bacillus cereus TaxID=1396 RepID=UPI0024065521|nr:hypothetical protein [Bacillus cereus]MDF9611872.1 hypothetical protein [Bacillus cereus]